MGKQPLGHAAFVVHKGFAGDDEVVEVILEARGDAEVVHGQGDDEVRGSDKGFEQGGAACSDGLVLRVERAALQALVHHGEQIGIQRGNVGFVEREFVRVGWQFAAQVGKHLMRGGLRVVRIGVGVDDEEVHVRFPCEWKAQDSKARVW